jgi:2-dehydro-3-deoxygalactonokinase
MPGATKNPKLQICLDVGITQTRAWLRSAGDLLAHARTMEGIRSGFVKGSRQEAVAAIDHAIGECLRQAGIPPEAADVEWLAAAGMVTSELGPYTVPHLDAPCGVAELTAGLERRQYRGIVTAPIYLVPGIRFGSPAEPDSKDAMRGEETLIAGLLAQELLQPGEPLLNLGSHWKLVETDTAGRVTKSLTGLGGEMIFALARETILKGSLPEERPQSVDLDSVEVGRKRAQNHGLGRALFLIRMDAVRDQVPPDACYWQLAGAVIEDFRPGVFQAGSQSGCAKVGIAGYGPLAEAWTQALAAHGLEARVFSSVEVDGAFCAGLAAVVGDRLAS